MSGSTVLEMLHGRIAEAVGWTLVHSLWELAVIAGVGALALWMGKRVSANGRYLLACGVMGVMVLAPVGTFLRVFKPAERAAAPVVRDAREAAAPAEAQGIRAAAPVWTAEVRTAEQKPETLSTKFSRGVEAGLPYALAGYFAGVIFLSLRLAGGCWRLAKLRQSGRAAPEQMAEIVEKLRRRLGIARIVRVMESLKVEVPTLVGWVRPVIFLPASAVTGLSPDQLAALVAHELAHIRRHDYLVNLVQTFAETVLFYHPAVWWISARIRQEREHCCDDVAVRMLGDRAGYAGALVSMESLRGLTGAPGRLAVGAKSGALLERVRRIVGMGQAGGPRGVERRTAMGTAWAVAGVAAVVLLTGVYVGCRQYGAAKGEPGNGAGGKGEALVYQVRVVAVSDDLLAKHPQEWNTLKTTAGYTVESVADEGSGRQPASAITSFPVSDALLDDAAAKALLEALQADRGTVTVAMPRIRVFSGQKAMVAMTQQQPYIKGSTPAGSGTAPATDVGTFSTGLTLEVNGTVSQDQRVVQTVLNLKGAELMGIDTFSVPGKDGEVQMPEIHNTHIDAMAAIPVGRTLVVKGSGVTVEREHDQKVPGLSELPGAGGLFTTHSYTAEKQTLLIFLTVVPAAEAKDGASAAMLSDAAATQPAALGSIGEPEFEPVKQAGAAWVGGQPAVGMGIELVGVDDAFLDDFRVGLDLTLPRGVGKEPPEKAAEAPHASVTDEWTRNLFDTAIRADRKMRDLVEAQVASSSGQAVDVPMRFPAQKQAAGAGESPPAADRSLLLRYMATLSADKKYVVVTLGPVSPPGAPPALGDSFAIPPHVQAREVNAMVSIPLGGSLLVNLGRSEVAGESGGKKDAETLFLLLRPSIVAAATSARPAPATAPAH